MRGHGKWLRVVSEATNLTFRYCGCEPEESVEIPNLTLIYSGHEFEDSGEVTNLTLTI